MGKRKINTKFDSIKLEMTLILEKLKYFGLFVFFLIQIMQFYRTYTPAI